MESLIEGGWIRGDESRERTREARRRKGDGERRKGGWGCARSLKRHDRPLYHVSPRFPSRPSSPFIKLHPLILSIPPFNASPASRECRIIWTTGGVIRAIPFFLLNFYSHSIIPFFSVQNGKEKRER